MSIILEEHRFGPLTNWRMARHHSVENGGPVTSDQVGLAAVNLEQYIVGNDLSASMVLSADEYRSLRADVNDWVDRRAAEMAMEDAEYWGDDYDDDLYDYDAPVFLDDWGRASRFFW
ncbi:MAG TPA: hypothetical protein VJK53_00795 [Candidatus Paceibacterota bacterium]